MRFLSRREAIRSYLQIGVLGVCYQWLLSACGTTPASAPALSGACATNGTSLSIGTNHGHTAPTISAADVTAGTANSYTLGSGTALHTHTLAVTAANFATLQSNTAVAITSSTDSGHSHVVTVSCA